MKRTIERMFPPKFWGDFYFSMLRNGRIWDAFEPIMAMGFVKGIAAVVRDIFPGQTMTQAMRKLVTQWTEDVPSHDVLTISALLDFFMSLVTEYLYWDIGYDNAIQMILWESTPLALALVQNNQSFLKTRPYLRWVLTTSRHAYEKASKDLDLYIQHLRDQEGVTSYSGRRYLPQYIPYAQENPGWQLPDAAPEFREPIKLVLRMARDLSDYKTEAMSLQQLILLSKDPATEFAELCEMQKSTGDLVGYVNSLISRYLVTNTDDARMELLVALSDEILNEGVSEVLDEDLVWKSNMLLYSLKGGSLGNRMAHHFTKTIEKGLSRELRIARGKLSKPEKQSTRKRFKNTMPAGGGLRRSPWESLDTDTDSSSWSSSWSSGSSSDSYSYSDSIADSTKVDPTPRYIRGTVATSKVQARRRGSHKARTTVLGKHAQLRHKAAVRPVQGKNVRFGWPDKIIR